MVGLLLPIIFCIAVLVFAALIMLVVIVVNPNHSVVKYLQKKLDSIQLRGWKRWIPILIFFGLLGTGIASGALFFLAVLWVMTQNPAADASHRVGENEKRTARRVYTWLFWSPFLTVPFFIAAIASAYDSSRNYLALAALAPLVLHLFLLSGLTSKSVFVYRHTQQGILLIALRASLASLAVIVGSYPEDGLWLFLFGNGALWLFSSIWGWNQVGQSDCWLMRRKGESISVDAGKANGLSPKTHLEKSREFLQSFKKDEAKTHALAAFRSGNSEIRAQAVWLLDVLEEVEKF